jgi:nucleoside-diphosphate-sugar epimerase
MVSDVDVVYHVAGLTCAFRPQQLMKVNREGTARLAQACAQRTTPPTLVLMSSLAAAGPAPADCPVQETDPPRPVSHYGRSKRAGEQAAAAWAGQVPLTIVRPGIVFGPRNRELLPIFRSVYRLGVHAVPGIRALPVSLIYVDDLVEITRRAAQHGQRVTPEQGDDDYSGQGYYFACSPEQITYGELGQMVGRALGRDRVVAVRLPAPLPWLGAAANQLVARLRGKPDTFNLDKIREARAGSWLGTAETVRQQLGFQPPRSLDDRMTETAQWYLQSGWL